MEENKLVDQPRNSLIDFIKGMLICGVVYGHAVSALWGGVPHQQVWLHAFVRTYDLPFFMVLSGYFLKKSLGKRGGWGAILNRVTMILVPIVVWTFARRHVNIFSGMYYFLWAVFCSALILIAMRSATRFLPDKARKWIEIAFCVLVVILFHVILVPWNLFYLFPFFAFGFFLSDVNFRFSRLHMWFLLVILALGLCVWDMSYTPWATNGIAWKINAHVLGVYAYRFVLALVGICVMANVFKMLYGVIGHGLIVNAGKETLALYILHIPLFSFIRRVSGLYMQSIVNILSANLIENIIGYVIAPCASLFSIWILLGVIKYLRMNRYLRYTLGFRIKNK